MKRQCIFLIIGYLLITSVAKGQTFKVRGRLYDPDQQKVITSGIVYLNPDNQITLSDNKGEYYFTCQPGRINITTRVLGYYPANIKADVHSDTVININLKVSPFELSEVTVTSDSVKSVRITAGGSFILTPATLRETPKLFSEPDLLRSFQLLPGVVAGKDGSTDIYVRGGGAGQNIVLANGCYFFLPGHLLGFVSPYDLDFLEKAELYKDYFPPELGGGVCDKP